MDRIDNLQFLGYPGLIRAIQNQSPDTQHALFFTSVYIGELQTIPQVVFSIALTWKMCFCAECTRASTDRVGSGPGLQSHACCAGAGPSRQVAGIDGSYPPGVLRPGGIFARNRAMMNGRDPAPPETLHLLGAPFGYDMHRKAQPLGAMPFHR